MNSKDIRFLLDRREFLHRSGVALGSGLVTASGWCSQAASENTAPPNILFIAVDDLNDWIGCLGGHPATLTPNMDRLAKRGTLFENAHCQAPICGPSRASLMSGLLPSTTGIYGQLKDEDIKKASEPAKNCVFLPEYLRAHGYKTMGVGKIFHNHAPAGVLDVSGGRVGGFGPRPAQRIHWKSEGTGSDWGPYPESDDLMPDFRSALWAVERLSEMHDMPFFLAAGFLRPHVPWHVPKKWFDLFDPEKLALPPYLKDDYADLPEIALKIAEMPKMPTAEWAIENNQWHNMVQAYLACVAFVDHYIGQVLDALERSAYAANTYIVLWSDHGYHLGEKNRFAKHSLWERATRAPLIIAGPGLQSGRVCSKPVGMIDLYPTVLDLCGLPAHAQNQGHSLTPLLANSDADWPHAAVTTYGRENHAVRTERYRYIVYEDGSEELYDHQDDRNEWHNIASDPASAPIKAKLKEHLPKTNAPWSPVAKLDVNEYFRKTAPTSR